MTTTITHAGSGQSLTVDRVLGYSSTVEVPTVVHAIVGVADPDFTVAPGRPRTGTYDLFCLSEADAITLRTLLTRNLGAFTLTDTDTAMADTTFLVTGNVVFTLDDDTRLRVIVSVDYTETTAA
jgi:hypothetical protein